MSQNMVNFGPLAAEVVSLVWGTPANFNGFRVLAALLHGTLVLGDFLRPVFSGNRAQHVSHLHSKFAPKPHYVWKYGIQSPTAEIRRGKKEEEEERRNHRMKI